MIKLRGIEFGFDSAKIDESAAQALNNAVELLEECESVEVNVDGYTDTSGPASYNQELSKRRAESVKQYLSGHGVDVKRLETKGLGNANPVSPNDTREGRALNRRVELIPR